MSLESCIALYDRITKSWQELSPKQEYRFIYGTKIFGDKLVYTFLCNPVIDAAGDNSSDDYGRQGDPLKGVMQYDFKTQSDTLLVSNRRNPPLSPIDSPTKVYKEIVRISTDEFSIEGSEDQVYNALTGVWRTRTPDDQSKAKANLYSRDLCDAGGITWDVRYKKAAGGALVCYNNRKPTQQLMIPLSFDDADIADKLKPYAEIFKSGLS